MEQGATDLSRISFEEEAEQARIGSKKKNIFGGINQIELRLELSDLLDDDNAANKTYESRILEEESSSDESNEGTHGNT
ncbi:hypothetical protein TNCV_3243901 [Trichonephila clavipes]|nr:hypothetical protein TNCV_3243901 [Trichonephila clavipes]